MKRILPKGIINLLILIAALCSPVLIFAQPGTMSNNTDFDAGYGNRTMTTVGQGNNNTVFTYRATAKGNTSSGTYFYQFNTDGYYNTWNLNTPTYNSVGTTTWCGGCGYNGAIKMGATTTGRYYTFNLRKGTSYANQSMAILETAFNPTAISNYTTGLTVYQGQSPTVTVTMANALNTGEYLYLAYSTDGFVNSANSGVVAITSLNGSFQGTAALPSKTTGTVLTYYPFTSTSSSAPSFSDIPLLTLNMRNSAAQNTNGSYTSYTVSAPPAAPSYMVHKANTTSPSNNCSIGTFWNANPAVGTNLVLQWNIEFSGQYTTAGIYYTTDGTTPSGSKGVGTGTTNFIAGSVVCTDVSNKQILTGTIPAAVNTAGTTIKYIIGAWNGVFGTEGFASTTYVLNNTTPAVYSYSFPTISLANSTATICKGVTTANLSYSGVTNSPNQYSIVFDQAGIANVTNATLSASPIAIAVPSNITPGTYTGNLTVKDSATGISSTAYPISIIVNALPTAGITNNTGVTTLTCSVLSISLTATGGTSYSWSDGTSVVSSIDNLTVTAVGTYTVTVTDSNGCSSSASIVITQDTAPTSSSQTETACDTYTWSVNGTTYTTSGTYTFVGTNAAGCTDTKTLNLTINSSTSSSESVTACDTYTWPVNGLTYTTSGTYTYISTNAAGCPDTKTLVLTINNSTSSYQSVSACDTYTWSVNNEIYTESGTYTFVSTNAAGCTDTKSLELTIYVSTPSSQTVTACDSYTWSVDENTYTTSGTYVFEGFNAAGCPQNQTLYLTINSSTSSSQSVTACDTYTWSVNGQSYTTSGTYTSVSTNAAGCADTKTLNLTINNSTSTTQTVSVCDAYIWSLDGKTYTESGTYAYTSTNGVGCTDTKTLNLTITPSTSNSTTIAACGSYLWSVNGQTYTESGTYMNVSNCHTETLELTITPSTNNSTTATACDSYLWSINGQTYTSSGTYTSVTDCHTETLVLTINNSTSSSQTATACESYIWSVNGTTYTSSGTYTFVGTNAAGCTDTKTLNLTINTSTSSSQTVSACGSYTWSVNGTTYTTSGTYTYVGTNALGCSDTQTLNLTISGINKSSAGSTWINAQNDNTTGFGAWALSATGGTAGFFTGTSDINNGGTKAWGMYASGGANIASAVRPVSISVGNTITFSMDNGFIDAGKTIGFGLQNGSGQNLAELIFVGGQSFYRMIDANSGNTSIGYTGAGLDISLTYTDANTYSITVSARGGSTATYTGRTFSTQAGGQKPAQIRFFNAGAGTGGNFDLFFNSLTINNPVITTQPATAQQNICAGSTPTNLTVAASGSGQTFQWYSNSLNGYTDGTSLGSSNGANTTTLTPQNTIAGTTYYYCVVTDPCGITYSNVSGAVVVTSPLNAGTLSGANEICAGGLTTFSTNGTIGGSWSSSDLGIASVNTSGVVTGVSAGSATNRRMFKRYSYENGYC